MARRVLVEVQGDRDAALVLARAWAKYGFVVDEAYGAVSMEEGSVMIRGALRDGAAEAALKAQAQVLGVWDDASIAPASLV